MASQESAGSASGPQAQAAYLQGWQAISRMMDEGSSWSGHERNCAYLSLGDGTFVDASAVLGLDQMDDSRALAMTDWDGDGDLDMWLRNRGGPQLRFLESRARSDYGGHFIALELEGRTCNRDAVGARVELRAGGELIVRERRAGQGYLAQSSPVLTIPLGAAQSIESLVIHWPGGEAQQVAGLEIDQRYRIVQGEEPRVVEQRPPAIPSNVGVDASPTQRKWSQMFPSTPWVPADAAAQRKGARVVLRTPLPLEPGMRERLGLSGGGPRLLLAWSPSCASCLKEIEELGQRSQELQEAQLGVVPICLEFGEDEAAARAIYERYAAPNGTQAAFDPIFATDVHKDLLGALLAHIAADGERVALPTSLLINDRGVVEILYRGPLDVQEVLEDARTYGEGSVIGPARSAYGGRWLFGSPRDLGGLAREMRLRSRRGEAAFYDQLHRYRPRRER